MNKFKVGDKVTVVGEIYEIAEDGKSYNVLLPEHRFLLEIEDPKPCHLPSPEENPLFNYDTVPGWFRQRDGGKVYIIGVAPYLESWPFYSPFNHYMKDGSISVSSVKDKEDIIAPWEEPETITKEEAEERLGVKISG